MRFREKVEAVKAIPDQIRWTMILSMAALFVAFIALSMSAGGMRRAN